MGGGGWSWVEVEMSWVEMDGAGWRWVEVDGAEWRWVHGLVIPIQKQTREPKKLRYLAYIKTFLDSVEELNYF